MKRYLVNIELEDGSCIEATVSAKNKNEVLSVIKGDKQYEAFVGNGQLKDMMITQIVERKVDYGRFSLKVDTDNNDVYIVTDSQSGIVLKFVKHNFNGIQNVSGTTGCSQLEIATVTREMGEFVGKYFADIAFPKDSDLRRRIKNAISKSGRTNNDVSEELGITPQSLSNYLCGHRPLPHRHIEALVSMFSL